MVIHINFSETYFNHQLITLRTPADIRWPGSNWNIYNIQLLFLSEGNVMLCPLEAGNNIAQGHSSRAI